MTDEDNTTLSTCITPCQLEFGADRALHMIVSYDGKIFKLRGRSFLPEPRKRRSVVRIVSVEASTETSSTKASTETSTIEASTEASLAEALTDISSDASTDSEAWDSMDFLNGLDLSGTGDVGALIVLTTAPSTAATTTGAVIEGAAASSDVSSDASTETSSTEASTEASSIEASTEISSTEVTEVLSETSTVPTKKERVWTSVLRYDHNRYYIYFHQSSSLYFMDNNRLVDFVLKHFDTMQQELFYVDKPYIDAMQELIGSNVFIYPYLVSSTTALEFLDMLVIAKVESILDTDESEEAKIAALSELLWYDESILMELHQFNSKEEFLSKITEYLKTKREHIK
jgi:hypothetical protein